MRKFKGGARGVMVIVVGNGHDDTSSNPGPHIILPLLLKLTLCHILPERRVW